MRASKETQATSRVSNSVEGAAICIHESRGTGGFSAALDLRGVYARNAEEVEFDTT